MTLSAHATKCSNFVACQNSEAGVSKLIKRRVGLLVKIIKTHSNGSKNYELSKLHFLFFQMALLFWQNVQICRVILNLNGKIINSLTSSKLSMC